MTPSIRIDYDETGIGLFTVRIIYHEGDTAKSLGQSAEVVVYVDSYGRSLPESIQEISTEALAKTRIFLQKIIDRTN